MAMAYCLVRGLIAAASMTAVPRSICASQLWPCFQQALLMRGCTTDGCHRIKTQFFGHKFGFDIGQ